MTSFQGVGAVTAHPAARRWPLRAVLFTGVTVVAVLLAPWPAAAHAPFCAEIWNPHGQTTPPAGFTTAPGTTQPGQNEDGFYQVGSCVLGDTLVCPTGLGGPEFAGLCCCDANGDSECDYQPGPVFLYDGCGDGFSGFQYDGDPSDPDKDAFVGLGAIVKYIEWKNGPEVGTEQRQELMAGTKQGGSPAGDSSDAVKWQLWGEGDLLVCDGSGEVCEPGDLDCVFQDPPFAGTPLCTCCYVPPPPKAPNNSQ